MTLGIDRSTLPPPVATTNICPIATTARKEAELATPDRLSRLNRAVVPDSTRPQQQHAECCEAPAMAA